MYLSEGESFLTSSLSYRYCLGIKLYSFSSRNPFHRQFFHATQKKPVNCFVCGCINFIVTHQVYKYWRIGRQTTFFDRELLINKITTRSNRKYCNIRNDDCEMVIENFAEQYYSNKYEESNLHHILLYNFLEFRVPYSLFYLFTRIERTNDDSAGVLVWRLSLF